MKKRSAPYRLKVRLRWILRKWKKLSPPNPQPPDPISPSPLPTQPSSEPNPTPLPTNPQPLDPNPAPLSSALIRIRKLIRNLLIPSLELWRLLRLLNYLIRQSRDGSGKN